MTEPATVDALDDEPFRSRLLRVGSSVACTVWVGFAAYAWAGGSWRWATAMFACGIAASLGPLIGRFAGSGVGGSYFSIVIIAGLTATGVVRGGFEASVAQWNALPALIAVLGGRPRKACLWASLCVTEIAGLLVAEHHHWLPQRLPSTAFGPALSTTAMLLVVGLLGVLFHRCRVASFARHASLQHEHFQSQKLEGLGRLAGGIAHDFNNLLVIVSTRAELAAAADASEAERREDLLAIVSAARQGAALARDLVSFAGSDSGSTESLRPSDVVGEVSRLLARVLPKDVRLETELHPESGQVLASHRRLHQVLMNLCINAAEAMPQGGTIRMSVARVQRRPPVHGRHRQPRDYVRIRVADDGTGMTAQTRQRMLEPFFTTKSRGTGLGLATVQRIVREFAGELDVTSEPGKGSTFDIYLPALPEPERAPEPEPGSTSERARAARERHARLVD